jgi:ABC-type multidrug transport system fused ATPase/permease subunit
MRERLDESERFGSADAIRLIGRALRYIGPFRFEFSVKLAMLIGSFIPMLFLPWPTRILIDQVIMGIPFGEELTPFPFFIQPFVDLGQGLSTTELLAWTIGAQFALLVLIGAFGVDFRERDRADARGVPEGWDTATRTENEANSGFSLIGGLLGLIDYRWTMRLTQKLNHYYRTRLFDRIQSLPMTSLDDERIGDAVYRVMYDTTVITSTCYKITLTPIASPAIIMMTVWVMGMVYGWQSPIVWAGLGFIGVAFIPTLPLAGLHRRYGARSRRAGATTTSSMEEAMSNVLAVQSLGGEGRERKRFGADSEDSFRQFRLRILVEIVTFFLAAIAGAFIVIEVLYYICDGIIDGRLSLGDFAVLLSFFITIAAASVDLGAIWIRLQNEATGLNRVFFLMDAASEHDVDGAFELPPLSDSLVVDHVHFAYEADMPTLEDVSFEAHLGQVIAFAGPAGAGKTTLAYLVPRFIEPQSGQVRIDGHDIADVSLTSLRSQIAFVFQETVLFDASIEENIKLGNRAASETDIRRAARIAGAHEFIEALPDGYRTRLGRAGGKLSAGQKQRLSIARALVRNAPILILDEPTSALDPDTERQLVASLREASRTRIVIVIAHRLSTIRGADEIFFLDQGRIVERGSHAELMRQANGAYRTYVELQTRGVA